MKKWVIILLFTAALHLSGQAQSTSVSFRNININEGLSQSSVVDIAADHTGFLWFATQDGLNRFDGKEFLIFKKTSTILLLLPVAQPANSPLEIIMTCGLLRVEENWKE